MKHLITKAFIYKNPATRWFMSRLARALSSYRLDQREEKLREAASFDSTVTISDEASIINVLADPHAICIGPHSMILGELRTYGHGGNIVLGSYVFLGSHSKIWSSSSVTIGNHVLISHNVNIHDNDSHSLDIEMRRAHTKYILDHKRLPSTSYGTLESPVKIDDDAWIGFNATILKGVNIGRGAMIAAGAVVTKDVEPFTLVAGNPALVRKKLPSTRDRPRNNEHFGNEQ